ncbi:MAG: WXG100 family type VII secretion target [Clostridium sp.]|jgi:WXG100 family type VII secretion target|nr:WXG100 family type VII secretion target [Clostridium sp.]
MANIRFSPEEVSGISSRIVASKESVESEVQTLQSTIDELCDGWDGVASDKYRDEFAELKSQVMDKFVTMLDELHAQLDSISEAMQQADQDLASKISMR